MSKRSVSWEIVLAGLAFIIIGGYILSNPSSEDAELNSDALLPAATVIDLRNLDNLRNLGNLKNLDQLKNLKRIAVTAGGTEIDSQSIEKSIRKFKKELQQVEDGDFNIRLVNGKVFINKNYDVAEGTWTETKPGVFVHRQTFDAGNLKNLSLELGFGNIRIVGSDQSNGELTIRASGDLESAKELSENLSIRKQVSDNRGTFEAIPFNKYKTGHAVNLEATLTIPTSLNTRAVTAGGHLTAQNLTGGLELSSEGGHITLHSVKDSITATTSGGHITGQDLSGTVSLVTKGGHIKLKNATGKIQAETAGGNIEIQDLNGQMDIATGGGSIKASVAKADGPLRVTVAAGTVDISLPVDITANLKADAGQIHLSETFDFSGNRQNSSYKGTINGGGIPVVIDNDYGKITITEYE